MSKAALQASNTNIQSVMLNGQIALGSIKLRYGRDLFLEDGSIGIKTCGYYKISETITVQPEAIGEVAVKLQHNGIDIPGAISYGYATEAAQNVTVNIDAIVRVVANNSFPCENVPDTVTAVLTEGPGNVVSVIADVVKL